VISILVYWLLSYKVYPARHYGVRKLRMSKPVQASVFICHVNAQSFKIESLIFKLIAT